MAGATSFRELQGRLAVNVRMLRQDKGWSQEEAAHRSRVATRLLQRVEGADVNFTARTLARLSLGLEVDAVRLLKPALTWQPKKRGRPRAR